MADKLNPVVTIKLGDKELHLKYSMGAFLAFKRKTGKDLLKPGIEEEIFQDTELMLSLIWAGLVWENSELTVEHLAQMLDLPTILNFVNNGPVKEAMGASLPEKGEKEEAPLVPPSQTG